MKRQEACEYLMAPFVYQKIIRFSSTPILQSSLRHFPSGRNDSSHRLCNASGELSADVSWSGSVQKPKDLTHYSTCLAV